MKPLLKHLLKMALLYSIFLTSTFHTSAQTWNEIIKVTAQNNGGSSARSPFDEYGKSVSISGNYAIVGAYLEDEDENGLNTTMNTGAAYILFNNAGNWIQVKKITAPVREAFNLFGFSVSISGDYAIVGAYQQGGSGSAYIFEKDQGGTDNWGMVKKVTASTPQAEDRFGYAVSISGNYALVGAFSEDEDVNESNTLNASGSAYIFKKDEGGTNNWGQIRKITASTRGIGDWFGYAVSINGDYAIVGARYEEEDALETHKLDASGSAYIFKKDQGGADNWGQVKKITASVRAIGDTFGHSVSISGDYAIVGAPEEDEDASETNTSNASGSAYIFKKNQGGIDNWGQLRKITATDRAGSDNFGISVSIGGDYAIVGAYLETSDASEDNTLANSGSAYIFKKDQGGSDNWGQAQKITPSDRANFDLFGFWVAIDGNHAIVGAYAEDEDASGINTFESSGSAYFFHRSQPLPVTLTTFKAVKNESQVLLTWATTIESNSDYFAIQKSANGFIWRTLGRVLAAVKSDQLRSYSFTDPDFYDEKSPGYESLYRLKMVDLDGGFTYSRIISLSFDNHLRTILYPNPVSDKLYCNPADAPGIESISIINSAGQIILQSFDIRANIPVNLLSPGIHLAQIKTKTGAVQFQKIVVVR